MSPQPDRPPKLDSNDSRRQDLKHLVEIYALRSRQLSEAVATLGWYVTAGRPFEGTMMEIERCRLLCQEAGADLFDFLISEGQTSLCRKR